MVASKSGGSGQEVVVMASWLFRIRQKDGSLDPSSAGTYVDAQRKSTH
jgi:hypothetical protein